MDDGLIFEQVPMLRALREESRALLRAGLTVRALTRGETVWVEGARCTELTFVLRGSVKLRKSTSSGRTVLLNIVGPGEAICPGIVCAAEPYCCTALAMADDTSVASFPRHGLLEILERHPSSGGAIVGELGRQCIAGCRRIEELSSGRVEQRLASLLLRLASQSGVDERGGVWVPIPLSRQDLANLCGTTVETAIRTVRRFEEGSLLRSVPQGFVVTDGAGLARIAAGTDRASPRPSKS